MGNINYSKILYKIYGNYAYFFHNQLTTKTHVYHSWQNYSFCRDEQAQQQGPIETGQPMCSSQQLKLT